MRQKKWSSYYLWGKWAFGAGRKDDKLDESQEKSAQSSPKAICGKIETQRLLDSPPFTVTSEGVFTPPTP